MGDNEEQAVMDTLVAEACKEEEEQNHATSHLGISKEVEDKNGFRGTMLDTSKETTLVKHAAITITDASCSKNTESSDNLVVKQGILIQHLVEKVREMTDKIIMMERVLLQRDAGLQETLEMLDFAKVFFDCFKPTRAAAKAAISFLSVDDDDIVQKINYMKDFFSYFVPLDG